jgi:hypothetical protein
MRNKVGLGLVAVMLAIVGPPFVALSVRPYEPPLRVGMTPKEVQMIIGLPQRSWAFKWEVEEYYIGPDCCGNHSLLRVFFEKNYRPPMLPDMKVISWQVQSLPRTRPPWLDAALKWVGW